MKNRFIGYGVIATAIAGVLCLMWISMPAAQNRPAAKPDTLPTPRLANGHPDLTGYWAGLQEGFFTPQKNDGDVANVHYIHRTSDGSIFYDYAGAEGGVGQLQDDEEAGLAPPSNQASYKPEYMAKVMEITKTMYGTTTSLDPAMECKPAGVPRAGFGGFVVSSPQAVSIMYEAAPGPYYRIIYTDGRQHPKDLDTSYMGHSIGHWEGDTLVVDVVGLNDETWIGGGTQGPRGANIHSDKEHVIERWTRRGDELTYEATVEDPVMFTKPWVITPQVTHLAVPGDYIQAQMCVANDKAHLIRPSEKDQFLCTWCQKDPDAVYGPGASKK